MKFGSIYASPDDEGFIAKYRARCHCHAVRYEVRADPVGAKICHCSGCQTLHGAPMQWAAIFHKRDVRFTAGVAHLHFYNGALDRHERLLPCKVACALCRTLIADEGRNMWLAFPTLFDFGAPPHVPEAFRPTCHIYYAMREAIAACAKAVELSPNNADFRGRLAFTLVYAVQPKEALHHLAVCLKLSSHYPNWFTIPLVLSHYLLGDFEEARNAADDAIARFSDYIFARINLAGIYGALSDTEMARGVAHDILQRQPDFSVTHYAIGLPFKDPTVLEAWLGHLRSAGLPD